MQPENQFHTKVLLILGNSEVISERYTLYKKRIQGILRRLEQQRIDLSISLLNGPQFEISKDFNSFTSFYEIDFSSQFDSIVCLHTFDSSRTLDVFNKITALLRKSGRLHVFNIFSNEDNLREDHNVTPLNNIKNLALTQGYELDRILIKARDEQATFKEQNIQDLLNYSSESEYFEFAKLFFPRLDNQSSFYHLVFSKKLITEDHLQYINESNLVSFEVLFEQSFGHKLTESLWHYKYSNGAGFSLGLFRSKNTTAPENLIAHYGGIKREILFFGKPKLALQIGDVMVDSSKIKSLSRRGPFFNIATTFLDQHIGFTREALVGFGFPNLKAMKVASLIGIYQEVDQFMEISWPVSAKRFLMYSCFSLNKDNWQKYEFKINQLWRGMSNDLVNAIVGVRSSGYLYRRFLDRPGKQYKCFLVMNRFTKSPTAMLVLTVDGYRCELIDLVVPFSNVSVAISIARYLAYEFSSKNLFLKITKSFSQLFNTPLSTTQELDIKIPANSWTRGPDIKSMQNSWWLTSGDMDFV